MPWKITNTVLDPTKAMLRRQASRLSTEPLVCGRIMRVRSSIMVSDEEYEKDKARIELCVQQGVISVEQVGGAKKTAPAKAAPEELPPPPAPAPEPEPEPEPVLAAPEPPPAAPEPPPAPEKKSRRRKKGKE